MINRVGCNLMLFLVLTKQFTVLKWGVEVVNIAIHVNVCREIHLVGGDISNVLFYL